MCSNDAAAGSSRPSSHCPKGLFPARPTYCLSVITLWNGHTWDTIMQWRKRILLEGMLRRHTVFPNLGTKPQDALIYAAVFE